jgi:hypothetical protein
MGEASNPETVNAAGRVRATYATNKAKAATPSKRQDRRPTPDQMYLAEKLNGEAAFDFDGEIDNAPNRAHFITPAALQRWNLVFGIEATTGALRAAWGFPPLDGIANPFAYVVGILRSKP